MGSTDSKTYTALLTRSIMDMQGEGTHQLVRYKECTEEIQEGSETSAAEKVKSDAQLNKNIWNCSKEK